MGLGVVVGLVIPVGGIQAVALIALGLVAVGIAVRAPGVLFALYLLIPFYKGAAQPYSPLDITLVLALLNSFQFVWVVLERPANRFSHPGITLWVAIALMVMGGVLYAPDQTLALNHAVSYWLLVFIPLTAGALRVSSDMRHVRQLLWTFFGMGILTTAVGVLSISSSDRLVVLGANTINVASAALLAPLLGLMFVARHGKLWVRLLWIVCIPPALIVGLASGSRGPVLILLAMAMVGAVRYLAHPGSVNWPRTGAVTGAVLAVILVVSFASASLPTLSTSRFASFGDFVQTALTGDPGDASAIDTSATVRVALYRVAAAMFQERPVLGFGTAGFEAMSNRLLGFDIAWPHDALLQFAAEFGLVGAALFVSLAVMGLTRRLPDLGRPVRIAFLYFLLQAMISGDIFSDRTTWGLLLVMLLMQSPAAVGLVSGVVPARREALDLAADGLAS